jgi:hypothetical protein
VTATGTVPMSYQWRFNGVNLSGETNATLQIAAASLAHEGDYSVLVSNPAGALASAPAALAINRGEVAVAARLEGNEVVIRVTGPVGRQVDVEASQNLQTWTAAGTLTLSGGQAESRQPTNSGAFRFYRAQLRP